MLCSKEPINTAALDATFLHSSLASSSLSTASKPAFQNRHLSTERGGILEPSSSFPNPQLLPSPGVSSRWSYIISLNSVWPCQSIHCAAAMTLQSLSQASSGFFVSNASHSVLRDCPGEVPQTPVANRFALKALIFTHALWFSSSGPKRRVLDQRRKCESAASCDVWECKDVPDAQSTIDSHNSWKAPWASSCGCKQSQHR